MSFPTSPNDPVFFLHHCYLDLLWERWKRQHPTSAPYLPQTSVPGMDLEATLVFHASGNTAPWEQTWT
ncbi:tyrosinase family protein, partial [Klebsiella quasipneumoniae]